MEISMYHLECANEVMKEWEATEFLSKVGAGQLSEHGEQTAPGWPKQISFQSGKIPRPTLHQGSYVPIGNTTQLTLPAELYQFVKILSPLAEQS
jgi:hypothetical protein